MKKIERTTYSVSDFLEWQRAGTLHLNPEFQRRPVWKPGAKSFFIDTIIRGYPVPVIFLRNLPADLDTLSSAREVVDGQQRIRTLISYIQPSLLEDYDESQDGFTLSKTHNKALGNKSFQELPKEERQKLLNYSFGVHTFSTSTSDREVFTIFARMNATGVRLNAQELRNANYYGEFKTLSYNLASEQLDRWRDWNIFSNAQISRMLEVELTSELIILIIQGISEKSPSTINSFYDDLDNSFPKSAIVTKRFRTIMDLIDEQFDINNTSIYQRRTLFYCLYAAMYKLAYGLKSQLKRVAAKRISSHAVDAIIEAGNRLDNHTAPRNVQESITRRTSHMKERTVVTRYLLKNT